MKGSGTSPARAWIQAYTQRMQILPVSNVKDRLNELVDSASRTHEQVTITKNGSPAAVPIRADEWEALQETLFWLGQEGIRGAIGTAREEVTAG